MKIDKAVNVRRPVPSLARRAGVLRLPRPLWIGIAALVLIATSVAMSGLPIYRQHRVYRTIHRLGVGKKIIRVGADLKSSTASV